MCQIIRMPPQTNVDAKLPRYPMFRAYFWHFVYDLNYILSQNREKVRKLNKTALSSGITHLNFLICLTHNQNISRGISHRQADRMFGDGPSLYCLLHRTAAAAAASAVVMATSRRRSVQVQSVHTNAGGVADVQAAVGRTGGHAPARRTETWDGYVANWFQVQVQI